MDLFHYFESNLFTLQSMNLIIANSINSTTAFMLMRVHITGLAQSHLSYYMKVSHAILSFIVAFELPLLYIICKLCKPNGMFY